MLTTVASDSLDLMARLRDGDLTAPEAFVRKYTPYLQRVARRELARGPRLLDDKDDFSQKVLSVFFQRKLYTRVPNENALLAYLRKMVLHAIADARNQADALKRGGHTPPISLCDPDINADVVDPHSTPQYLADTCLLNDLEEILPPGLKTAFHLRRAGYTREQAAIEMCVSLCTIDRVLTAIRQVVLLHRCAKDTYV